MIRLDEDALICDLAETYHIYDYRSLPPKLVATLSAGLRDNSRIKLRALDIPVSQDTLLLATIADRVELFRYSFMPEGKAKNFASLTEKLLGEEQKKRVVGFKTAEEFEKARARIIGE